MSKPPRRRGAASRSTGGHKPKIAYETELQARRNLEGKLRILDAELKRARAGGSLLPTLPTSPKQFNEWAPEVAGETYARNSQATLRKHDDIHGSVKIAVEAVKLMVRPPPATTSRTERIASLRRTLNLHKVIRQIAETEMVRLRGELKTARLDLGVRSGQLNSAQNEIGRLREELAGLERRVAEMSRALATIRPMRRA